MDRHITNINLLLSEVSAPIEEINNDLRENLSAVNVQHVLLARPEFVHAHVGVGFKYLPKHIPDVVACRADTNQGRLVLDSAVHTPFRKEGDASTVVGVRVLLGDDSRSYTTYDLLPAGGELVVSVLFSRERVARLGGGFLELSVKKK